MFVIWSSVLSILMDNRTAKRRRGGGERRQKARPRTSKRRERRHLPFRAYLRTVGKLHAPLNVCMYARTQMCAELQCTKVDAFSIFQNSPTSSAFQVLMIIQHLKHLYSKCRKKRPEREPQCLSLPSPQSPDRPRDSASHFRRTDGTESLDFPA